MANERKSTAPDITYVPTGRVVDPQAMRESLTIDVPNDKRWFREHPNVNQRLREASPRELRAHGLPEGTLVLCERVGKDSQSRTMLAPPPF